MNKFCQSLGFLLYRGSTVSGRRVTKIIIIVVDKLEQTVTIQAAKLRCYEENYTVLRQNGLFECSQKRLFEGLEGNEKSSDVTSVEEKCQNIWGGIWEEKVKHNAEAECLQDFKNELDALGRQGEVKVSAPMIKKQLRKIVQLEICGSRWYAWLLAEKVYRVTCLRSVLEWLTNGRTVLVVKHKGREVNCLTSDQLHAYLYN